MLKRELEALCAEQRARIEELEAQVAEGAGALVNGYLVFAGGDYGRNGGWNDYRQCFADERVAVDYAQGIVRGENDYDADWAQVVELPTGRVQEFERED